MNFDDSLRQNALLRKALKEDHDGTESGKGRSVMAIYDAVNTHRGGLTGFELPARDANRKSLERYIDGQNITNIQLKRLCWNYYTKTKKVIKEDGYTEEIDQFILVSETFFKNDLLAAGAGEAVKALKGNYFSYKRAVRRSDYILRYLLEIVPTDSSGVLKVRETHINRSMIADYEDQVEEIWEGVALVRKRNVFVIMREQNEGTPRAMSLHSPQRRKDGVTIQMEGEEIESVEFWGDRTAFWSKVFVERAPDGEPPEKLKEQLDLIRIDELRKSKPYVCDAIIGPADESNSGRGA